MGCESCSSNKLGVPAGCRSNGSCQTGCGSILDVYDWLSNVYFVDEAVRHQIVEIKFKGTRKGFYRNVNSLPLEIGDKVVVEAHMGGHDLGIVSLVGPLIKIQMKKYKIKEDSKEIRKIYRLATERDIEKWREAKAREYITQMKARTHAIELGLQMKISDVEFQGDNTKATFYYTADGRVDFRELIKVYARNFKIKIEMRQIGLRQEAGRLGGIGSCGRELCCSTWLTDFKSVPTTAARYQNLFLNPLKLSGQCGRLKCCLNYELDVYLEALEEFPEGDVVFKTGKGRARMVKTDILKRIIYFTLEEDPTSRLYPVELDDVKDLLEKQKRGESVMIEDFEEYTVEEVVVDKEVEMSGDIMADDLDRFDKKNKPKKKRRNNRNKSRSQGQQQGGQQRGGQSKGGQQPSGQGQRTGNRPDRKDRDDRQGKGRDSRQGNADSRKGGNDSRQGGPEAKKGGGQRNKNAGNRGPKQGGNRRNDNRNKGGGRKDGQQGGTDKRPERDN